MKTRCPICGASQRVVQTRSPSDSQYKFVREALKAQPQATTIRLIRCEDGHERTTAEVEV